MLAALSRPRAHRDDVGPRPRHGGQRGDEVTIAQTALDRVEVLGRFLEEVAGVGPLRARRREARRGAPLRTLLAARQGADDPRLGLGRPERVNEYAAPGIMN